MNKVKLDDVDHQILDILIDNTRVPFTDISKRLFISAGTVHVRVKKMEEAGIIKGSSLNLDYVKLGYSFIAYIGIFLEKTKVINDVIESLNNIPFVTRTLKRLGTGINSTKNHEKYKLVKRALLAVELSRSKNLLLMNMKCG